MLNAQSKGPAQPIQPEAELAEALENAGTPLPLEAEPALLHQDTEEGSPTSAINHESLTEAEPVSEPVGAGKTELSVQIHTINRKDRTIPLKLGRNRIGRQQGGEIVLDEATVSEQHAYIEYDGETCRVVDMSSSHGSFLSGVRLLPGSPAEWGMDKPLHIGGFWLFLKPAKKPSPEPIQAEEIPVTGSEPSTSQGSRIVLVVNPTLLSVVPGGSAELTVDLINQGQAVEHCKVSVEGLPGRWIRHLPPAVELKPGGLRTVRIRITPPRHPKSRAGRHPFQVRVASQTQPGEVITQKAILTVDHYVQFTSRLEPQKVQVGEIGQVIIENRGNLPESFNLRFEDRRDELHFNPPQTQIRISGGKSGSLQYRAQLQQMRWVGGDKSHIFSVQVSLSKEKFLTLPGEMVSRAWLPAWMIPLFAILCVLLLGAAAVYRSYLFPTPRPEIAQLAIFTPTPTSEPGAPSFEWCIYPSTQPPAQLTTCPNQVFLTRGQNVTITWRVSNAEAVRISPLGNRPDQGQEEYLPLETISFTIKAFYQGKPEKWKEATIQVVVEQPTDTPGPMLTATATPTSTTTPTGTLKPTQTLNPGATTQAANFTATAIAADNATKTAIAANTTKTASAIHTTKTAMAINTTKTASAGFHATVTAIAARSNVALSIVTTADPTTYHAVDQAITYRYVIKNTGNAMLTGSFLVWDDKTLVACTQPEGGALSPNEEMHCTANYKITQADLDAGSVTSHATASGGGANSNQTTTTVTATQSPAISIDTRTNGLNTAGSMLIGEPVEWTYKVTNTGNVTLHNVAVTDDMLADDAKAIDCGGQANQIASLAPGAANAVTCTASGITMPGSYNNEGAASGNPPAGNPVTASDSSSYFGADPKITFDKVTVGSNGTAGDGVCVILDGPVTWEYTVTNTGNVALSNVTVADNPEQTITCPAFNTLGDKDDAFDPGEAITCKASAINNVMPEDLYNNEATASGSYTDDAGNTLPFTESDGSSYISKSLGCG